METHTHTEAAQHEENITTKCDRHGETETPYKNEKHIHTNTPTHRKKENRQSSAFARTESSNQAHDVRQ
jgi:hypothetical protein